MTNLALGLDIHYEGIKRELNLTGDMNRQVNMKSSTIQNSSEMVAIDFRNELSQYDRITLNNTFIHTQVPGSFEEQDSDIIRCRELYDKYGKDLVKFYPECNNFLEEFGRVSGRFDSYSNTLDFNYNRELSESLNATISYTHGQDWSTEQEQNSYSNSIGFGVNYSHNIATSFILSCRFAENVDKDGEGVSSRSVSVGMRRSITKRIYFNGDIGMNFAASSYSTSIGASLTGEIDEKTTADLSYSKELSVSSVAGKLFDSWSASGRVSRLFSNNLNGYSSVFYGHGKFVSDGVEDTLMGASVSLGYNFWADKKGKKINGSLGYTFSELTSSDEARGYTRSGVTIGLSAGF